MTDEPAAVPHDDACDELLLARIAGRDRAAFAALFRRWAGRVRVYILRGGASAAEADEAAQEVMLAIWRRADSFDPGRAAAAAWIYGVARNRRVDMHRRRRPEPDPQDPQFRPDPEPPADAAAAARDRDRALRAALSRLSAEQLDVVRATFYDGMSHAEAAAALDLPLGTVKSRLRLAMGRLRDALGPDFAQELVDD